jgi:hypothetical protein
MYSVWYISCLFIVVLIPSIYRSIENSKNTDNIQILNLYVENINYYTGKCINNKNFCLKANISGRFTPCFNCLDQKCSSEITVDFMGPEAKIDSIIIISSYNCGDKFVIGDVLYERKKINDRELMNIIFYHFMIPVIFVALFETFRYSRSNSKIMKFVKDLCCIPILQNEENINNRVQPYLVNENNNNNNQNNNENNNPV